MKKDKWPIPDFCKSNCRFRKPKAKYMPACDYAFKLIVKEGESGQQICCCFQEKLKV